MQNLIKNMINKLELLFYDVMNYLSQPTDSSIINVYITVSLTAAVLFITISIIPFQQYATTHSLSVLKYLQKCKKITVPYMLIIFFSIMLLILPLLNHTRFHTYLGLLITIFILVMIGYSWKVIINLLNPEYFLLPKIKSDIEKTIDKCILNVESTPKTDLEKINELRDMMNQSVINAIKIDPEEKYYKISRNQINPAYKKTLLLKELITIYARKDQRDLFTIALQDYNSIIIFYMNRRKNYVDNHDDFLIDIADDLTDIIKVVDIQKNIHFHRAIWKLIENICNASCFMNSVQSGNGNDSLCRAFTDILNESFYKDFLRNNYDSAFEIARSLGEIGSHYAIAGIFNSAANIVEKLKIISEVSISKSRTEIAHISRYYIAKTFYNLVLSFDSKKNYEFAFKKILNVYEEIILKSETLDSLVYTDYIFWYDPDVSRDLSLAAIFRLLLFPLNYSSDKEYDSIQYHNKDIISKLQNLIKSTIIKKPNAISAFVDQLYQISLYYLSYIHHQVCTDILITYSFVTVPSQDQKNYIIDELDSVLDFYFNLIIENWKDEKDDIDLDTLEHSFFSILLMDIYWSSAHNKSRLDYLQKKIEQYFERVKMDIKDLSIQRETIRLLIEAGLYIKRIDLSKSIGRKIFFIARKVYNYQIGSELSIRRKNFIKRPIHMFNQEIFIKADQIIFGKD